jgi:hypothetical protein
MSPAFAYKILGYIAGSASVYVKDSENLSQEAKEIYQKYGDTELKEMAQQMSHYMRDNHRELIVYNWEKMIEDLLLIIDNQEVLQEQQLVESWKATAVVGSTLKVPKCRDGFK